MGIQTEYPEALKFSVEAMTEGDDYSQYAGQSLWVYSDGNWVKNTCLPFDESNKHIPLLYPLKFIEDGYHRPVGYKPHAVFTEKSYALLKLKGLIP